jgi:phosphotransferase system HPr (HPr) family protein
MKKSQVILQCEGGLHLRVAARIVNEVQHRQSTVHVRCEGCPWANGCSIFELLKLGAEQGTPLEVTVEGADEEATLQALSGLLVGTSAPQ